MRCSVSGCHSRRREQAEIHEHTARMEELNGYNVGGVHVLVHIDQVAAREEVLTMNIHEHSQRSMSTAYSLSTSSGSWPPLGD